MVIVKGSKQATATDGNGEFMFANVKVNAILIFTSVTLETFESKVPGQTEFTVKLKTKKNTLDEAQVIAYGTTTKGLNTGNVSTIKAVEREKQWRHAWV